jgi:hypothetical protein
MNCVINLAKAWFRVDNRHTSDHQVVVSINTVKYPNNPYNGFIRPQMSHWMLSRNFNGFACILRGEGLEINFPVARVVHMK